MANLLQLGALLLGLAKSIQILSDFQKQYRGLCAQDLQEAKDLMLVETADMLRVIISIHHWNYSSTCVSFPLFQ